MTSAREPNAANKHKTKASLCIIFRMASVPGQYKCIEKNNKKCPFRRFLHLPNSDRAAYGFFRKWCWQVSGVLHFYGLVKKKCMLGNRDAMYGRHKIGRSDIARKAREKFSLVWWPLRRFCGIPPMGVSEC